METQGNSNGPGSPHEGTSQDVEESARGAADKARSQVRSLAESSREELAEQIGGFGRALRDMGNRLRNEENEQAAHYTDLLGNQADRVSRYLSEHDTGHLVGEVEDFAREHPLVFIGGCVGLGFAIGRFFKASVPERGNEMPLGVMGGEPAPVPEVHSTEPIVVAGEPSVTTTPIEEVRPLGPTGEER